MSKPYNFSTSFKFGFLWLFLILVCSLLTACGFQLRGSADLPDIMQSTYLDIGNQYGDFARNMARTLEANGVEVVDDPELATAILHIPEERFIREAASFSGDALISEFRISYQVRFQLLDNSGESLSSTRTVKLFRDYSFDSQEVLASQREEEFLRENLRDSMSYEILRRLETIELDE